MEKGKIKSHLASPSFVGKEGRRRNEDERRKMKNKKRKTKNKKFQNNFKSFLDFGICNLFEI